jgi:hypothetical protein
MVMSSALNLSVFNRVSSVATAWNDVAPLCSIATRPLATVLEIAFLAVRESYLHLHPALAAFPVLHRPVQNVVD